MIERALSMTQPWATLVVATEIPGGGKSVENRKPGFSHKSFRGEFYIHAARGGSVEEYQAAYAWVLGHLGKEVADRIPDFDCIQRCGIIGAARAVGIVAPGSAVKVIAEVDYRWHMLDQWGFELVDRRRVRFVPCRGYLGFWRVPADVLAKLQEAA